MQLCYAKLEKEIEVIGLLNSSLTHKPDDVLVSNICTCVLDNNFALISFLILIYVHIFALFSVGGSHFQSELMAMS